MKTVTHTQETITYPRLPLAVYRELAAHLLQIEGVTIELISQQSQEFVYELSQIDHLKIAYASTISAPEKQRIEEILDYYAQIHTPYTREFKEYSLS